MNKGRRIEIEIRRREISVALQRGAPSAPGSVMHGGAVAERPSDPCPACGAEWVLCFDASPAVPPVTSDSVRALLETLALHVRSTASGHLWICRRSFDQLKEQRL